MANDGIYEGGLPTGGTSLYPGNKSDMATNTPPGGGGQGRIDARPGTPPQMNSSYAAQTDEVNSFIDQSSYKGDMNVGDGGSMKVRNPDDLSSADSGKMP